MVKLPDIQDLLRNYTQGTYDDVWLGGRYSNDSGQYHWLDGEPLEYTNWLEGHPLNSTDQSCIEYRPGNERISTKEIGKWVDVNCLKRNLVVCQKPLSWSLRDAITEIQRIRKLHQDDLEVLNAQLEDASKERRELETNLATATRNLGTVAQNLQTVTINLQTVTSRVVPVGSIYIEYYNQPSPRSLWPNFTWQDVSSTYAGLFFRAYGSGSASWGSTQAECAPRITQMDFYARAGTRFPYTTPIPANGWSERGSTGDNSDNGGDDYREGIRLYTQGCEVRPKNQAIRIWKRTS